jgi:hypothetical protein
MTGTSKRTHPRVVLPSHNLVKGGTTIGDKKKPAEKKAKKKLEIKKETIQELSKGELDQVAGGATATCLGEGVQRDQGPLGPTGTAKPVDPHPTSYCVP